MRLNAATTAATTTRKSTTTTKTKPKAKTKQTLQASTTRSTSTSTRTKTTTTTIKSRDKCNIESFICNLIQLFILTTSIMCMANAIGSGLLQVQAQSQTQTQTSAATGGEGSSNMDAFSGQQQQFDELLPPPPELATTAAPFQFSTAAASHTQTHSHTHMHSHTHQHPHQHQHPHSHTHIQAATTLRVSYDSNEIDNSYAIAAAEAAAAEADDVDSDADADADADSDADDVETVADDYVIALGHGQNTTKEKNDRATPTTSTTTAAVTTIPAEAAAANGKHLMNAKTQDLLSLSQLSSHQTSTAPHEKNASSLKNSLSSSSSGGASSGGNFQQIGSQRVNGNVSPTAAAASPTHNVSSNGQQVAVNGSSIAPTLSTSTSNVRTSAKKVDSKFILPKQQKTDAPMLNYIFDTFSSANKHHHHDQRYGPHFEDVQRVGQPTNMTVQAGSSIHLNCRISLLQDKTVSWVRRSAQNEENGLDLLTVGLHAYTGDKRYKMEFQYPNNWRLKIINVKKDDEATYECQISTHPPRVIQINLHVNAPKVMIVDEYGDPLQEKYYEIDSTLQLSCVVRNVAMTSSVVFWKHSENVLNYDVTRGGVSVKTELMEDGANSTLFIAKIHKADSGNYTCSISEFQNFTIVVHILNGESFAELHHGAAGVGARATWQYIIGLYVSLLLLRWLRCSSR